MLPPAETDLFRGRLIVRESTKAAAGKSASAGSRKRPAPAGKPRHFEGGDPFVRWRDPDRLARGAAGHRAALAGRADAGTRRGDQRADPRPYRPLDCGGRRDLRPPGSAWQRARRLPGQRRDLRRLRARASRRARTGPPTPASCCARPRSARRATRCCSITGSPATSAASTATASAASTRSTSTSTSLATRRPSDRPQPGGSDDHHRADHRREARASRACRHRRDFPRRLEVGRLERVPDHRPRRAADHHHRDQRHVHRRARRRAAPARGVRRRGHARAARNPWAHCLRGP